MDMNDLSTTLDHVGTLLNVIGDYNDDAIGTQGIIMSDKSRVQFMLTAMQKLNAVVYVTDTLVRQAQEAVNQMNTVSRSSDSELTRSQEVHHD